MKNTKTLLLTFISLVLIAASVGILWKSGFFLGQSPEKNIITRDSSNISAHTDDDYTKSDSLATMAEIAMQDSINNINNVSNDSIAIDANTDLTDSNVAPVSNLDEAKQKINLLEEEIVKLKNEKSDYEKINKDLFEKLNDKKVSNVASNNKSRKIDKNYVSTQTDNNRQNNSRLVNEASSSYSVTKLSLQAFETDNDNEARTDSASNVSKISALFSFNNADVKDYNGDIMLVITQPDGKAFRGSPWQVGVFETSEGRRIYSCKFQMNCSAGGNKDTRIDFFRDDLVQGIYTLQVYKNGFEIGKTSLKLL